MAGSRYAPYQRLSAISPLRASIYGPTTTRVVSSRMVMSKKQIKRRKKKKKKNMAPVSGGSHRSRRTQRIVFTVFALLIVVSFLVSLVVSRGRGF